MRYRNPFGLWVRGEDSRRQCPGTRGGLRPALGGDEELRRGEVPVRREILILDRALISIGYV